MIAPLAQHSYVSLRCACRRLLIGLLILGVVSAVWRLASPFLVAPLARSSVGCPGRGPLLAAALRQMGHVLPADARLFDPDLPYREQDLRTHSLPRPGWVAWYDWELRAAPDDKSEPLSVCTLRFADADLRTRGSLTWSVGNEVIDPWAWPMLAGPPGDYDGDGQWEIALKLNCGPNQASPRSAGYAVIRLGNSLNQVAAYVVIDTVTWSKPRPFLHALWDDIDGDGSTELMLISMTSGWDSAGRRRFDPPRTYAVFAWTGPGGTLVPKVLPPEGGVYVHTIVDNDVTDMPRAEDIAATLQQLHTSLLQHP